MRQYWFDETMFKLALKSSFLFNSTEAAEPNEDIIHLIDYDEYKKLKLHCDRIEKELSKYRPESCTTSGVVLPRWKG